MAQILDQYGRPIEKGKLGTPQTADVTWLKNAFLLPWIQGLTPASLSDYLSRADMGFLQAQHRIFADMEERDPHLAAEIGKRKQSILTLDWRIEPPKDASAKEKADAEWAEEAIENSVESFEDLVMAMGDAIGHGFAPIELEWQMQDGELLPIYHPRPQEWFRLTVDRRELRINDGSDQGMELQPFGWIMHQPGKAKTGYLGRMGLYRVLSWPFLYKAYAVSDMAEYLETFGLPIIVGKYGQQASAEAKQSLMEAVTALGHDARAIMPVDMQLEIQKVATGSGSSGIPHLDMVKWADEAQSKAILGQTLSADAKPTGLGSGVAKLQGDVRDDILRSDARRAGATLTRDLVYPAIVLNRNAALTIKRCPRLVFDLSEKEDIAVYAGALPNLAPLLDIPQSWVRERLGIPQPQDGEQVLSQSAQDPKDKIALPPAGLSAEHGAGCSCCGGTTALSASSADEQFPDQVALDAALAAIPADQMQALSEELLKPVIAALEAAGSFEAALAALSGAFPKMDSGRLEDLLARAQFASELWGYGHGRQP